MIIRIFQLEQYEVRLIKNIEFCGDYQKKKFFDKLELSMFLSMFLFIQGFQPRYSQKGVLIKKLCHLKANLDTSTRADPMSELRRTCFL